jgi:hypothetical protein
VINLKRPLDHPIQAEIRACPLRRLVTQFTAARAVSEESQCR